MNVNLSEKSIVLLGPTPPPLGGVSIHVSRLSKALRKSGVNCFVLSTTSNATDRHFIGIARYRIIKILSLFRLYKGNLVVVNSSELYGLLVAVYCKAMGGEVVQYFHNGRALAAAINSTLIRFIIGRLLRTLDAVFVVNGDIARLANEFADNKVHVSVVSPFIPPHSSEFVSVDSLGIKVGEAIYIGWCGLAEGDRAEIYGLDFFISVLTLLKDAGHQVIGVFGIGDYENIDIPKFRDMLSSHFGDGFIVVPPSIPFVSVTQFLNVFVRPTSSDGDAVSVREALHLRVPVVASDVVTRPEGVGLFRFGDLRECCMQIERLLSIVCCDEPKLDIPAPSFFLGDTGKHISHVSLKDFITSIQRIA